MTSPDNIVLEITPEVLLKAYACGIFPMAESADDPGLYWIEPERRGILPLDDFHVPSRLARLVRQDRFEVRVDTAFSAVLDGCAAPAPGRQRTWINSRIRQLYTSLHALGQAHSVEAWLDGELVGGLYGVRLAGAFFGESMFSRVRDASKVALVHLAGRLRRGGFTLLDAQFITDHLAQFGAVEISRNQYQRLLDQALEVNADFAPATALSGVDALAAINPR
ncbi:leucyl/phenylalanyl-tRNA--protein transferase [Acuticoccus mangrovi]|uniref:Leucyl/phenylalanyl-tRNA--protein transferase n=1 Tax=Acuticoccus mangrovi TaxID=2796142 RepID=A0A934IM74_9HYPH|nr:leucyl/phenylalanyl-tRNA--protein transferase [Acuticoccus mangrovi]MBJ3774802.1 leucyl/phenylalanyl-tRNA--protein transferase [Acuticoccus mangrovi]